MTTRPRLTDVAGAACGLAAGGVALAVGQVNARLVDDGVPPLRAMGDLVIRETPVAVTNAVIDAVGTHDKALLRACVLVVAVALAGLVGVAYARGRRAWALLGVALLALAPVLAVAAAPTGSTTTELLVVLPAALLGGATLAVLAHPVVRGQDEQVAPPAVSRRQLLRAGAVVVLAGAIGQAAFRALSEPPKALTQRLKNALPLPARPLAPLVDELGASGATPLVTPVGDFYRIDTALELPLVDPDTWTLSLSRDGQPIATFTYDELLARSTSEADITIGCIDNEVGGPLIGTARWQGVLLSDLLAPAELTGTGRVAALSVDGFLASFPLEAALDGRPAMLALGMNGRPLPVLHGFPARLVVPGLYGFTSAVKWLSALDVSTRTELPGFWADRGWTPGATVHVTSRIDSPGSGDSLLAGAQQVAGIAWAPTVGVGGVEVQVDDGPWMPARLSAAVSGSLWRQFVLDWDATPGRHRLSVRATDASGAVQVSEEQPAYPSGATGLHSVTVRVS